MSESQLDETTLVSIATYWNTLEANLARNHLESLESPCCLEGDSVVTMNWTLANAVGGVKLLVREQDRERAEGALREIAVSRGELTPDEEVRSAAQQTAQPHGRHATPSVDADQFSEADQEQDEEQLTTRESMSDRALRGALIGLIFIPIQAYVFVLLIRIFLSSERLEAHHRQRAIWAAVINMPYMVIFLLLVRAVILRI